MNETVLVLGANGRLGRVLARAFADAGWDVVAQARRPLLGPVHARIRPVRVGAHEVDATVAAAKGASVVVNAMNPLYTNWDAEAVPLNDAAIAVARSLNATLMFPGNVYNFGSPMPLELAESTPQRPTNRKGEIRCAMEKAMRDRAPRSIVVRSGDFFGGPGTGSWMDQAIIKDLAKGRITYPGPRDLEHAWAFLPDLASVFVRLAGARSQLPPHDAFHFPGHTLTGDELVAGIANAARRKGLLAPGRQPDVRGLPWGLIRLAGAFRPLLRELATMSYLWREPHRLAGARLKATIGTVPHTPLDDALDATLSDLDVLVRHGGRAAAQAA